jgi:hypothetical protein
MNVFGRHMFVMRLLEWTALVPMLMFMTFSLDIRTDNDMINLWILTISQQFSVFTGCFANLTSNYTVAVILLVLSCVSFCTIYIALYQTFRRIEYVTKEAVLSEEESKLLTVLLILTILCILNTIHFTIYYTVYCIISIILFEFYYILLFYSIIFNTSILYNTIYYI